MSTKSSSSASASVDNYEAELVPNTGVKNENENSLRNVLDEALFWI